MSCLKAHACIDTLLSARMFRVGSLEHFRSGLVAVQLARRVRRQGDSEVASASAGSKSGNLTAAASAVLGSWVDSVVVMKTDPAAG